MILYIHMVFHKFSIFFHIFSHVNTNFLGLLHDVCHRGPSRTWTTAWTCCTRPAERWQGDGGDPSGTGCRALKLGIYGENMVNIW